MHHPDIFSDEDSVNRPIGIASVSHGDFENSAAKTLQGFGNDSVLSSGCKSQSRNYLLTHMIRKAAKFSQCSSNP